MWGAEGREGGGDAEERIGTVVALHSKNFSMKEKALKRSLKLSLLFPSSFWISLAGPSLLYSVYLASSPS